MAIFRFKVFKRNVELKTKGLFPLRGAQWSVILNVRNRIPEVFPVPGRKVVISIEEVAGKNEVKFKK